MSNSVDFAGRINREVNARVGYRHDSELYGRPEHWEPAGLFGDCEDYALEKRRLLLDGGWPPDKLGLVVCYYGAVGHCCLWVETDRGSYILDNNYADLMNPEFLPYRWEAMLCNGVWRALLGWQ